jgi:membrane-associated phospholipid phosphatase
VLLVGPRLDVVRTRAFRLIARPRVIPSHRSKPIGWATVRKALWFSAAGAVGAFAIAAATADGEGRALDRRLYRVINGAWGPRADLLFKGITELGSIWASVGATAALARAGRRREALDALGAAGTMWVLGQALKRLVVRPRPYDALEGLRLLIDRPRGTSWPSSHPAVLLAFVTVATRNLDASASTKAAAALLAGAVGLSRVYLGVHYPADVAGGVLLGRSVADAWSAAVSPRFLEATVVG